MPIDNQLLRTKVGIYNFRRPFIKLKFVKSQNKCPTTSTLFTTSLPLLLYCFFVYLLPIFRKGFFVTVKLVKPCFAVCAYVPFYSSPIKFCRWNLNGLAAHDFIKIPLIEAFVSSHNFDVLCLSETFLNSTIDLND